MKRIRLKLFDKIFLIIFIGLFIVETMHLYMTYQNNYRLIVSDGINDKLVTTLNEIETRYANQNDKVTDPNMIQYIEDSLKEYNGYYILLDNYGNTLAEDIHFQYFSKNPYLITAQMALYDGDERLIKILLDNISNDIIDEIEKCIQSQPKDHQLKIYYEGEEKNTKNEDEGFLTIVPTFLRINDKILFGQSSGNLEENNIHMYSSERLFYRDYYRSSGDYKNSWIYTKDDFVQQSYQMISHRQTDITIGSVMIDDEKQEGDLFFLYQIHLTSQQEGEGASLYFITFYESIVANLLLQTINENLYVYIFSIVLSLFMSLGISYMVTRRIKKIDKITQEIAQHHFDIHLPDHERDELGTLSHNINVMSQQLKQTIEKLNKEMDRVKQLESVRKEFIANFTHEIKTPLGIIEGYIELINEIDDERKKRKYLEAIEQEIERINELVLAMLNLSRLESGNVKLSIEEIDVEDTITTIIDGFSSLLEKRAIKVYMDIKEIFVYADAFEMEIVIKNFISNAIKHTPFGKNIYITYDHYLLSIENEGSYIEEQQMKSIWDTYVSSDQDGTGLGLAICRTVLDMHGFKYWVKNTDRGVCFIVDMHTSKE